MLTLSKNILNDLEAEVARNSPALSTERGDLFMLPDQPAAAIRLKVPLGDYLSFVRSQETPALFIVPVAGRSFQVAINGPVTLEEGAVFVADKKTVLL